MIEFGVEIKPDWGTGNLFPVPTVNMVKMADMIKALGAKWVRIGSGVWWKDIELEQGQYIWTFMDYMVTLYQSRGVEPLYIISGTPKWANGVDDTQVPPTDMFLV